MLQDLRSASRLGLGSLVRQAVLPHSLARRGRLLLRRTERPGRSTWHQHRRPAAAGTIRPPSPFDVTPAPSPEAVAQRGRANKGRSRHRHARPEPASRSDLLTSQGGPRAPASGKSHASSSCSNMPRLCMTWARAPLCGVLLDLTGTSGRSGGTAFEPPQRGGKVPRERHGAQQRPGPLAPPGNRAPI